MGTGENDKASWTQGPSNALNDSVDLVSLRAKLSAMTEAELIAFGRQIRGLAYPQTYDGDGSR
jgi:hypothetical protein